MNKKIINIIIAAAIGVVISFGLIMIQTVVEKKTVASNFVSMNNKLGPSAIMHGVNIYLSDDNEVPEGDLKKREGAVKLNGGPFEDGYKQMMCYTTKLVSGIDSSEVRTLIGTPAAIDIFAYYDEDMNDIMYGDTLMLVKKDSDNTNAELFYTYNDALFSEVMNGLRDKYGSDLGEFVFEINGAYIKGDEFIPKRIDYCRVGKGGMISDKSTISTGAKDREEMEAEGYEYFGIEDRFLIGDISDTGNFVTYCYSIQPQNRERMEKMMDRAVSGGNFDTTEKGRNGLFTSEYLRVNKVEVKELGKCIYAVSYKYDNLLYDIAINKALGGRGLLFIELFIAEFAGIMILSVAAALVVNKVKYRKTHEINGN